MTSSYNISRRSQKELFSPTAWEVQQKQGGICPPGYMSVPINKTNQTGNCPSDWKFCVPIKNEEGNPPTVPIKNCYNPHNRQKRHFVMNLYDLPYYSCEGSRTHVNKYPPHSRRPPRGELDMKDYFRAPVRYDGTGYHPVRTWTESSPGQLYPEFIIDSIPVSDEWDPFRLIQRSHMKKMTQKEYNERKEKGFEANQEPYLGTFYKY